MRSQKAFLNIVISMLYQIVVAVCGIIVSRLILLSFGSTYNGVVQSASQFLGMISVLTLGIAGATRMELYKTLARNDSLGTSRIVKATDQYMKKVGLIAVGYTIVLAILYPFFSNNSLGYFECVLIIGIVGIGTFAEYFFGITYRTLLMADQREYVYSFFQILATILNAILAYILIRADQSIFAVKFWSAIVFAMSPIAMSLYVKKNYSIDSNCVADTTALKERGNVAFHSIANIVHQYTDMFLMTIFVDARFISVYSVYTIATSKVRMVMNVFTTGLEAAFGSMWAKGEIDLLKRHFSGYEYLLSSFVAVVFSCIFVLIMPFVELYTKGVNDAEYLDIVFAVLMVLAELTYCIRQPYITLVQATGNYKATKKAAGTEAVINVVLSLILINIIGIKGVVVGTIVANVYRTVHYMIFVYRNVLNEKMIRMFWKALYIVITIAGVQEVTNILKVNGFFLITTWGQWFFNAIVIFIISVLVASFISFVMLKNDMQYAFGIAKRIVLRKGKKRG